MFPIPLPFLASMLIWTMLSSCTIEESALVPNNGSSVLGSHDAAESGPDSNSDGASGGDAGPWSSRDTGPDSGKDASPWSIRDSSPDPERDASLDAGQPASRDAAPGLDSTARPDSGPADPDCVPSRLGYDLCDGMDDDCDPSTPDGSGEPGIGRPCDGPDGDLCDEGRWVCAGGVPYCDDTTPTNVERCNGIDDDCNGAIDEGLTRLYYRDDDRDGYGVDGSESPHCSLMDGFAEVGGDCDDTTAARNPGAAEACTMDDTDCDGAIDEGCLCSSVVRGASLYSFCSGGASYDEARTFCGRRGQDLVRIEDAAENDFVVGEVYSRGLGTAYVGLHDDGHEGDWRWAAEEPLTYGAWGRRQPDNRCSPRCDENCGVVGWDGLPPSTSWNDVNCDETYAAVCEGPVP